VGESFEGEPSWRSPARILDFVVVEPDLSTTDVQGAPGDDPAGTALVPGPGVTVAGYRSSRATITLPARKFETYLEGQGLDGVIAARRLAGRSGEPGREAYSRCAKTLLSVGEGGRSLHQAVLGFPLEIMMDADPRLGAPDGRASFTVLFRDAPLSGVLVVATPKGDVETCAEGRTGADGRVSLELDRPGPWLVRCEHMIPATPDIGEDWESFWASLTFVLGSAASAR
jgi:hypothetical protein